MDSHRLAWAAGLFDGEGCVKISKGKFQVSVQVRMTHEATIRRFHSTFRVGAIYMEPEKGNERQKWSFIASGKDAFEIVAALQPYLFTKAEQAKIALQFRDQCVFETRGRGVKVPVEIQAIRELLYEELRLLNKRGT